MNGAMSEEVSRGLVYNPDHSSLLICSSNCTTDSTPLHNCDQDAERILSVMKQAGVMKDCMAELLTTSSEKCTKKGLQDAIVSQTSKVSSTDEYGLFIFIYCGGACDLNHGLTPSVKQSEPKDEDGLVYVDHDTTPPVHALVLKADFDSEKQASHLSGQELGATIASSPVHPKQVLVILDCPYAAEIGDDMMKHLGNCELNLIVSQGREQMPYYLSPLGGSTFSYFLCHFLSSLKFTASGMVKLRCLLDKVQNCCSALSSLIMVRVGDTLTAKVAAPEGRFVHIIKSADAVMEAIEERVEEDSAAIEETDGGSFGHLLQKYYKKSFFSRPVKLCNEAKDWVHFVTRQQLTQLQAEAVLEGQVLHAAVSAMSFSMAMIQSELQGDSIGRSNLFLQVYVYIMAALDMVCQDINVQDISLLQEALELYQRVVHAKNINEGEIKQLKDKIKSV